MLVLELALFYRSWLLRLVQSVKQGMLAFVLGLLLWTSVIPTVTADSVQVIINAEQSTNTLSAAQLRRIFTMRQRQWPDGSLIHVYVMPNNDPLHQHFAKSQLQLYPYQLERVWNKLVYSGMGERPTEVYSQAKMLEKVASTPGAIGYISVTEQGIDGLINVSIEEGNP
ncbi:hypothetical protein P2G88_13500 [Aliiglaciecola sp. CAU 1673]|uniref:hypothetical protein n=1 Tax=Aliiglaciecola sp. CAU 1673 TaxID=3032595 RepID=UPI0023DB0E92|nr:hypothetical protein [Aliiglaciecola sp. CAU 1673]MDF2179270.1 hypothetical protein [Aliiglaciecola sp. CAU 1673]